MNRECGIARRVLAVVRDDIHATLGEVDSVVTGDLDVLFNPAVELVGALSAIINVRAVRKHKGQVLGAEHRDDRSCLL
jgi:hypothetical protein